jgi:hypothetical protein
MPETTVTVEAVAGVKEGTNNKGQAWRKWSFKADDHWYSTFTEALGSRFVKGGEYIIEYSENEYGRTVKKIVDQAVNDAALAQRGMAPISSPGFTGGEKDRSIVRQVSWKAAVELMKSVRDNSGAIQDPQEAFKTASKVAHGIENDIYRDQPQPPAPAPEGPDDSSIPF